MPVELTVAVEMITNSFQKLSRMVNTWLMARSKGSLHFNVNYGRSSFSIRVTPSPSVSFPERQADNDTVQEYVLSSEVTLMSYISDISTVQTDIVRDVETTLSLGVQGADSQFWSFNRSAN